jgi:hypothetical protein
LHRGDLVYRAPHHVRAVKVAAERTRRVMYHVTPEQIQTRNPARCFDAPIPTLKTYLFEKPVQQIRVLQLFNAPAVHELPDDWIFPSRRPP